MFAWRGPCTCMDTQFLWLSGWLSCTHRPKWGTLAHGRKGRHLRRWTKSGRLQSKGSHFWGFRLGTILSNEKYEGCPNFLSWGCRHQVPSCINFANLQLGAEASSWKCPATREALSVMSWRGSSGIRLQWTQKDRKFLRARENKMLIDPRRESRFRWLEPIKNKRGQKEKFEMGFEKSNIEWA
jgi:hypothetical protein